MVKPGALALLTYIQVTARTVRNEAGSCPGPETSGRESPRDKSDKSILRVAEFRARLSSHT
ncbi:MAG TPA: hypothetical protein VJS64_04265, partial [Pyrinomonadaceae bacterium]|nr:hypothetical protein [Pyrinomonadaceae bacterium]